MNKCYYNCSLKFWRLIVLLFAALWIAAALLFGTAALASAPLYLAAAAILVIWLVAVGAPSLRRRVAARHR